MQQPLGFIDSSKPSYVCKLNKSLYGLKQAPKAWYDKLFQALLSLGFSNSQSDCSLFVTFSPSFAIILVHAVCKEFITQLGKLFPIKDLGPLQYFLGLEVRRSSKDIFLS